jgi:hypothetical protein
MERKGVRGIVGIMGRPGPAIACQGPASGAGREVCPPPYGRREVACVWGPEGKATPAEINSRTRSYLLLRSALTIIIWFPIWMNRGFL